VTGTHCIVIELIVAGDATCPLCTIELENQTLCPIIRMVKMFQLAIHSIGTIKIKFSSKY
jgi:hypothetical protein